LGYYSVAFTYRHVTLDHNCYSPRGTSHFCCPAPTRSLRIGHSPDRTPTYHLEPDCSVRLGGAQLPLQTGSPCIDAGDPTTPPGFDFDHIPTPQGSAVDMGAYEYHTKVESLDVGVRLVVAPIDTVDSGATITPQALVRNYGNVPASSRHLPRRFLLLRLSERFQPRARRLRARVLHYLDRAPRGLLAVRCSTASPGTRTTQRHAVGLGHAAGALYSAWSAINKPVVPTNR